MIHWKKIEFKNKYPIYIWKKLSIYRKKMGLKSEQKLLTRCMRTARDGYPSEPRVNFYFSNYE